jgi:predicted TIM-barrel fold metal-dependent hydrolase
MDGSGVERAVVLPIPGVATNEYVREQCGRFPDRLWGLYNPDFTEPSETLGKMERFLDEIPAPGLKLHPRLQGVTVADSIFREVLSFAAERGLPVIVDAFPFGVHLDDLAQHPLAYHRVAQELPELKLVLAHAGGYKVHEAFLVAKANPNVYLDISFTLIYFRGASIAQDVAFLCGRLPPGRVLYGSDFPEVRFDDSLETAQRATEDLPESTRAKLFGDAAKLLFGR